MTQEEKELLLKDICCRLPYGVKVQNTINGEVIDLKTRMYCLPTALATNFKPYLRPMSSMTEDEEKEYNRLTPIVEVVFPCDAYPLVDWLNKHHFDYRGLIPMGLALEAPEEMYVN